MADGFAYISPEGAVEVRTVSDTALGAKVNAVHLFGATVLAGCPESQMDAFLEAHAPKGFSIRPVTVAPKHDA